MDNAILINAIIRHVESRVKENIDYREIEKAVGFSYRYFREEFRRYSKMPLKGYINSRKIANIIFEMETGDKTLLTLANDYNYNAYDTFTRNFKREMSITPNQYKRENCKSVERKLIGMGTYAPVVTHRDTFDIQATDSPSDSSILYGVPKVEFASGKCTPFPACLEGILTYIGQRDHCSYAWLISASGAAFRFCWNAGKWDMSNSNLMHVDPQNPWNIYIKTFNAAGWKCKIMKRDKSTKDSFISHIRDNINRGNPSIALGIVGPPEASMVTGYENQGGRLLGWSYFQEVPEFSANLEIDKSGYFLSSHWWDNPSTIALMTLGEEMTVTPLSEILPHIHSILTLQSAGIYQAGQSAYKSWADDIAKDEAFQEYSITPILLSRFFCQADAETMIGEGRYWGAHFFRELGQKNQAISAMCFEIADLCAEIAGYAQQMTAVRCGNIPTEEAIEIFCKPSIRKEIVKLIRQAQVQEQKIIPLLEKIILFFQ